MNNYNRIKQMTVDEMAELLELLRTNDCGISSYKDCIYCLAKGVCQTSNFKQWLLQECE